MLSYLGLPPGLGLDPDCDGRLIPPDGRLLPELGNCALPVKYNILLFLLIYRVTIEWPVRSSMRRGGDGVMQGGYLF